METNPTQEKIRRRMKSQKKPMGGKEHQTKTSRSGYTPSRRSIPGKQGEEEEDDEAKKEKQKSRNALNPPEKQRNPLSPTIAILTRIAETEQ